MAARSPSNRRNWIRAGLVLGVLVSLAGLLAVLRVGPFEAGELPPLARTQARVRIVDEQGRPVTTAVVFALGRADDAPLTERWLPDEAVLAIPEGAGAPSFLVAARGFRLARVERVAADRVVRLQRGLRVRLALRNAPRDGMEEHVRFLLRIRPHADLVRATPGLDAPAMLDLMANLGGPGSGPKDLPRGDFGYALSRAQAQAGVLVPTPGRYHVHWGLMNLRKGTWFSLGDPCGRIVHVRAQDAETTVSLDVTDGDLQRTLEGLQTSILRLGDG